MSRKLKERDIAAYLTKRVAEMGGIYRKVSWEGRSNAPDYLIMVGGYHFFVETKAPGEKPRESQTREFAAMLNNGGISVRVVSNFPEVSEFMEYVYAKLYSPKVPIDHN